jgi:predicted metallo-beta-lactamase superfamily hydrolase
MLKECGNMVEAVLREELRRQQGVKVDHHMLRDEAHGYFLKPMNKEIM